MKSKEFKIEKQNKLLALSVGERARIENFFLHFVRILFEFGFRSSAAFYHACLCSRGAEVQCARFHWNYVEAFIVCVPKHKQFPVG